MNSEIWSRIINLLTYTYLTPIFIFQFLNRSPLKSLVSNFLDLLYKIVGVLLSNFNNFFTFYKNLTTIWSTHPSVPLKNCCKIILYFFTTSLSLFLTFVMIKCKSLHVVYINFPSGYESIVEKEMLRLSLLEYLEVALHQNVTSSFSTMTTESNLIRLLYCYHIYRVFFRMYSILRFFFSKSPAAINIVFIL